MEEAQGLGFRVLRASGGLEYFKFLEKGWGAGAGKSGVGHAAERADRVKFPRLRV